MFDALRIGDQVAVRGYTAFPRVILDIAADLDPGLLSRPERKQQLVTASDTHLEADPLLRLELEMRNADVAVKVAEAQRTNTETATALLTRWAETAGEIFDDRVTLAEADAVSCWANSIFVDLRMTELTAQGRDVTVGDSDGVDQLISELTGAPAPEERISVLAAMFCLLAEMLSSAVSGRRRA